MSTWVLIMWMYFPYETAFIGESHQPAVTALTQEFSSEQACKSAFRSVKELNNGDINLRGVCSPKE